MPTQPEQENLAQQKIYAENLKFRLVLVILSAGENPLLSANSQSSAEKANTEFKKAIKECCASTQNFDPKMVFRLYQAAKNLGIEKDKFEEVRKEAKISNKLDNFINADRHSNGSYDKEKFGKLGQLLQKLIFECVSSK